MNALICIIQGRAATPKELFLNRHGCVAHVARTSEPCVWRILEWVMCVYQLTHLSVLTILVNEFATESVHTV